MTRARFRSYFYQPNLNTANGPTAPNGIYQAGTSEEMVTLSHGHASTNMVTEVWFEAMRSVPTFAL